MNFFNELGSSVAEKILVKKCAFFLGHPIYVRQYTLSHVLKTVLEAGQKFLIVKAPRAQVVAIF